MKLREKPQKDGTETRYDCGFWCTGSWSGRLTKHQEFCESVMGKYILDLEDKVDFIASYFS